MFKKLRTVALLVATTVVVSLAPVQGVEAKTAAGSIAWGIDVSRHQGRIDWNQVAQSGCKFAFIKSGNPQTGLDANYDANMRGASAAGIRTGVYYFSHATTVEQAAAEAAQTLAWIAPYDVNYPVVYDVEARGQKGLSADQMTAIVNTYCSAIQAAGYYPVVYSYKNFIASKLNNVGWDKWVAQYGDSLNYDNNVAFWQYTSHGSVPGIPGRVDMDYQYKDYDSLILKEGLKEVNGGIKYFTNWRMVRGFANVAGGLRFFDGAGNMFTGGWFDDPATGNRYYANPDGLLAAGGLAAIDNSLYNFDANGVLQRSGRVKIPGAEFVVADSNGVLIPAADYDAAVAAAQAAAQ